MDNHVHLVIQVGDVYLPKIVQNLSFRYTRYINRLYQKIGHLFQGRYKAILIDEDNYLLELMRYVHFNPVRAKMVNNLEEYAWSSHCTYLGLENIAWLTTDYLLSYFDDKFDSALHRYIKFMQNNPNEMSKNKFNMGNQRNYAILGNDDFIHRLKNQPVICVNPTLSLQDIINLICPHYSVEAHTLNNTSRIRKYTKIRAIIAWLAKEFNVCTYNDVAKFFNRDATGLIRVINRFEDSLIDKEELIACKKLIKSVCQA